MSQIEELQGRIAAALDRIGGGVETLAARDAPAATAAADDLAMALEEERLANAQLGERIKTIKARHEADMQALRDELDTSGQVEALRADAARLGSEAEAARAEARRAETQASEAKAATGRASAEIDRLKAEVARLTADLAEATRAEALRAEMEALRRETGAQADVLARLDMDMQRVRFSNDQLREVNAALRDSNAAHVGEPHLINKAMLAELEGLRAARAADVAEAGAVLKKLETLLSQAANLPDGEED